MTNKILVIGPSPRTRGGITSVINSHAKSDFWKKWNCIWISTFVDKNALVKVLYFFKGVIGFIYNLSNAKIIHIHFSEPTSAMRKSFFLFIAKLFKKKVLVHLHAFSPGTTINGKRRKLYYYIFTKADLIVALSPFWADQISKAINDGKKIRVIYNPCPIIKQKKISREKKILFAGTLKQRKGYADLIYAFSKIAVKNPNWNLIFAGNGEINKARQLAKLLKIDKQIQFLGWVTGKDKEYLFSSSSIFCLPSYAEGFPMAVLDAFAYGLPIITTPVGGLPDILENGVNALLFDCGDTKMLASHLDLLINDLEMRETLSQVSFNLSKTTFKLSNISDQFDSLYTELSQK